jgi:adenylate cyclase
MSEQTPGARLARETAARLGMLGWIASAVGASFVFVSIGFLIPIFTDPDDRDYLALVNAPLIVVFLVVVGLVVTRYRDRHFKRTLAWLSEGRAPDKREHRDTLRLALYNVKLTVHGWIAGVVVFFFFTGFTYSWAFAAVVAPTIWLGGETTSALVYLVSERILRPVTARALAASLPAGPVAPGVRARLLMAWLLGTGVPLLGVLVVGIVGLAKANVDTQYVASAELFLGGCATFVGLLATLFAAKAIAHPVMSVRAGLEQIGRGDLSAHVAVDDGSEVGLLQTGFNHMAEGLRERERIRDLFGRQVGEDVARAALDGGTRLGGEEREIGALFVDIVGSTSMAMAMPPTEVVRVLNRFFRVVVDVVETEGGFVNKFEGDAALCIFGAPVPCADPAGEALRCARSLAARLSRDVPEVDFGIGISAGIAVAGNIGAEHRFEYTIIGDPVNEAARLSEHAKLRPERVLASQAALGGATDGESELWSVTESALLRGRSLPTVVAHPRS